MLVETNLLQIEGMFRKALSPYMYIDLFNFPSFQT